MFIWTRWEVVPEHHEVFLMLLFTRKRIYPFFASRYKLFFQMLETVVLPRADVSQFMVTATFLSSQRSLTCVMFVLVLNWPRWALVVGAACASCNISSDLLLWHMLVVNIQSLLLSHTSTRKYHYKCLVCVRTCVFELEQWFTEETRLCFFYLTRSGRVQQAKVWRRIPRLFCVLIVKFKVAHLLALKRYE